MATLRKISVTVAGAAAIGALGFATPAAEAAPTPCDAQARACLQLHTNQAWLVNGGQVTYGPVPVTTGKPQYPTPTGHFRVQYKDANHYSKEFNGPMPYSVFFTNDGDAFHEGSLRAQSHGCVHLSHAAAVKFYQTLRPGDSVQIVP
ncbi:L,D-transpeptidase [Amycolatopsis sp. K13G38]|uniref:L,D-transpeptidase n=1 Tax=Amycolatopsis acididurans TaxID=2724524 RepID=A0ABX1J8E3_9PSEU|nr:L,D-transpeptidase [Amycolatopsis acididurans]NKQ55934.1 L,D-transpeptidase [Amycolatopsis acididurans]